MQNSKYLIVIYSRQTPLSPWCTREVERFIALHGPDRIIPVLTEGEPYESFPLPLRQLKKTITNDEGDSIEVDQELLAADLRPADTLAKDLAKYTQASLQLLRTERYRIIATMLGVSYGDLRQRDKERRTRRLLKLSGLASVLLLIFGVFMFDAYQRTNRARLQAQETNSAMLLNVAETMGKEGDLQRSLLVSGLALDQASPEMPLYEQMKARHYNILSDNLYANDLHYESLIDTNNRWTEGQEAIHHTLSQEREAGDDSTTQNDYDPESDLLLTILDSELEKRAVLIHFSTGEFIHSVTFPKSARGIRGFLSPGGERLYLGSADAYYQNLTDPEIFDTVAIDTIEQYEILTYEALLADAERIRAGRDMRAEEIQDLGLEK